MTPHGDPTSPNHNGILLNSPKFSQNANNKNDVYELFDQIGCELLMDEAMLNNSLDTPK